MTSGFISGNLGFFLSTFLRMRPVVLLMETVGSYETLLINCGGGDTSLTFSLKLGVSSVLVLIGGNLETVLDPISLYD